MKYHPYTTLMKDQPDKRLALMKDYPKATLTNRMKDHIEITLMKD